MSHMALEGLLKETINFKHNSLIALWSWPLVCGVDSICGAIRKLAEPPTPLMWKELWEEEGVVRGVVLEESSDM